MNLLADESCAGPVLRALLETSKLLPLTPFPSVTLWAGGTFELAGAPGGAPFWVWYFKGCGL